MDWSWRNYLTEGYRRPEVGAPTLRSLGVYPSDLARPMFMNPNGSASSELMTTVPSGGGYRLKPSIGPPSLHTFKHFPTEQAANEYEQRRHVGLEAASRFVNDLYYNGSPHPRIDAYINSIPWYPWQK